jgi:flagellar motor switch protein FliN/FliY
MSQQIQVADRPENTEGVADTERASETALSKAPPELDETKLIELNPTVSRLPIEIDVCVPVRNFRVRNLLALEQGQVIESSWQQGDDLPLGARGAQLAWSEFEVIDQKLAVRITRLL